MSCQIFTFSKAKKSETKLDNRLLLGTGCEAKCARKTKMKEVW